MASIYPELNDATFDLAFAESWNWYSYLVSVGVSGLTPPSWNDKIFDLKKKTAYFTALSVT